MLSLRLVISSFTTLFNPMANSLGTFPCLWSTCPLIAFGLFFWFSLSVSSSCNLLCITWVPGRYESSRGFPKFGADLSFESNWCTFNEGFSSLSENVSNPSTDSNPSRLAYWLPLSKLVKFTSDGLDILFSRNDFSISWTFFILLTLPSRFNVTKELTRGILFTYGGSI